MKHKRTIKTAGHSDYQRRRYNTITRYDHFQDLEHKQSIIGDVLCGLFFTVVLLLVLFAMGGLPREWF
jgi:hypothetical protein